MVKIKWLESVIRQIEENRVSSIVSVLTFCIIALVNWKWFLPFPFYNVEEATVIGFSATMSWGAFVGTEVAGMILMSLTKDKMRAEADARVSAAREEAARERAARMEAEARAARIESEARAEKPNGAEAAAKAASEAAAKAVAEAMAIVASEREKDREIILANQETIRSNQETIRVLVRQLAETRGGAADAGFGCV